MRINGLNSASDNSLQLKSQSSDDSIKVTGWGTEQEKLPKAGFPKNKYEKIKMPVSEKAVIEAIEKANKALEGPNKRLQFTIHRPTHEIMVKVINNDTGEVIREIPSEKILDMVAKMQEMSGSSGISGMIVDERR